MISRRSGMMSPGQGGASATPLRTCLACSRRARPEARAILDEAEHSLAGGEDKAPKSRATRYVRWPTTSSKHIRARLRRNRRHPDERPAVSANAPTSPTTMPGEHGSLETDRRVKESITDGFTRCSQPIPPASDRDDDPGPGASASHILGFGSGSSSAHASATVHLWSLSSSLRSRPWSSRHWRAAGVLALSPVGSGKTCC
jgi:hypothetical protein